MIVKRKHIFLFLLLSPLLGYTACRIMAEPVDGKERLSYLGDQEILAVEFLYPDPRVTHSEKESEYVREKVEEYAREQEGKGELFKKEWHQNKEEIYEPSFIASMNEAMGELPLKVKDGSKLDEAVGFQAVVKVTRLDPGVQPSRRMEVETRMLLKDKDDHEVMSELEYEASSFDSTLLDKSFHLRLKKGFEEAGKAYGHYFDEKEAGVPEKERKP